MANMLAAQAGLGMSLEIMPSTSGQGKHLALPGRRPREGSTHCCTGAGIRLQERLGELGDGRQ
jgi:hypothetical protein